MTAATPAQPAPVSPHLGCAVCASGVTTPHGAAGTLRADLEASVRIWREESQPYPAGDLADNARRSGFGYCADELAAILARHPVAAIAAQEPHAAPGETRLDDELAEAGRVIDDYREEVARLDADRDRLRGLLNEARITEPQPAPDLGTAWRLADERRELAAVRAEVIEDMLSRFGPSGSGHTARVGQVQIAKWRTRAGLTS